MATADVTTQPQEDHEVKPDAPVEFGAEITPDLPPANLPPPSLGWDTAVVTRPIGFGWDAEAVAVDWSGQGRADLLVTSGGGASGRLAKLYRVTSPVGEFPPRYDGGTLVEGLDGLRCVCPIPNTATSRFDLVGLTNAGLVLIRNQGTGDSPSFGGYESLGLGADLGIGPCRIAQLVAIDWDGDRMVDLLVGFEDLAEYWPDAGLPVEQQVGFNRLAGHPGYDRTGTWRGRAPQGKIRWLKNVGTADSPKFALQDELVPETGALDLDLNPAALAVSWGGGSALELMTSDRVGTLRLYRNFGGQRPPVLMEPRVLRSTDGKPLELPDDRTTLSAADLDGDRRVELLYGTSDGRVFAVHSGSARDTAKPPVALEGDAGELNLGGRAVVAVGDLDGDGGLDLVAGDAAGRLAWFKDLGQGPEHRYQAPIGIESGGLPFRLDPGPDGRLQGPIAPRLGYACPALADWNGNGRPDLILGGAGGELLWLKNDGSKVDPRFALPVPFLCGGAPVITPPRVRPATARWTDSGALDLIALDLQGFLCVYPGAGTNELQPPIHLVDTLGRLLRLDGGFGQNGRVSLWAGDWTGSGRQDILVGFAREARFVIPALIGTVPPSLDELSTVVLLENKGRDTLVPRIVTRANGSPIVVGSEGCSPSGVTGTNGLMDLIVGADDGGIHYFRRDELRW
jgi:hypothetical protein